jgi:hypothetical protein
MISDSLLGQSAEFESHVIRVLSLSGNDASERVRLSRIMCSVSLEHAESLKMLLASGNFTSAVSLLRLQYESLVRGVWALYAATDTDVEKLTSDLTHQAAKRADRMPMLGEMMEKLRTSAPIEATGPLDEFREYSWKSLSSYVHGGIHAIDRHSKGYPEGVLEQALRASNGLCGVTGMFAAVLTGDRHEVSEMAKLYKKYSDCLPMIPDEIKT